MWSPLTSFRLARLPIIQLAAQASMSVEVSSATTSALSLCKLILYSLINQMGKLHCAVTVRLKRYRSHIAVALITLERHRKILSVSSSWNCSPHSSRQAPS